MKFTFQKLYFVTLFEVVQNIVDVSYNELSKNQHIKRHTEEQTCLCSC